MYTGNHLFHSFRFGSNLKYFLLTSMLTIQSNAWSANVVLYMIREPALVKWLINVQIKCRNWEFFIFAAKYTVIRLLSLFILFHPFIPLFYHQILACYRRYSFSDAFTTWPYVTLLVVRLHIKKLLFVLPTSVKMFHKNVTEKKKSVLRIKLTRKKNRQKFLY